MTVHVSKSSGSVTSNVTGLSSRLDEGKLLMQLFYHWKKHVIQKHDCWRRRVVIGSSTRFQVKREFFCLWRDAFKVCKSERDYREMHLNALFDKISISMKVDVFFNWFRITNIDKRCILLFNDHRLRHLRSILGAWLLFAGNRRKLRQKREICRLKIHFKAFRVRITRLAQHKRIANQLKCATELFLRWKLWIVLRSMWHVYCEFRLERLRFKFFFRLALRDWRSSMNRKRFVSCRIGKNQKYAAWTSWWLLLSIRTRVKLKCMRMYFFQFRREAQQVVERIFFSIWKKRATELRKLASRATQHVCIKGWRKRTVNKQWYLALIKSEQVSVVKRTLRVYLKTIVKLFCLVQQCMQVYEKKLLLKSSVGLGRLVFRETRRNRRLLAILVLRNARKKCLLILVHWHRIKFAHLLLKQSVRRVGKHLFLFWQQITRVEKADRKRNLISEFFWKKKKLRFSLQQWTSALACFKTIESQTSFEKLNYNRTRNTWNRWQTIRPYVRIERGRWRKACEHCLFSGLKKGWTGWKLSVSEQQRKRSVQMQKETKLNTWRKPVWLGCFLNFQKSNLIDKKKTVSLLRICNAKRLTRTMQEWQACRQKQLANKDLVRKLSVIKFFRRLKEKKLQRIALYRCLKVKFFTKWVLHLCQEEIGRQCASSCNKRRVTCFWESWRRLCDLYERANRFRDRRKKIQEKHVVLRQMRQLVINHKRKHAYQLMLKRSRLGEFINITRNRKKFEEKMELAKSSFRTMTIKKGNGKLISALSVFNDKLEAEFLTCVVNRRFLLGKRVVRRWKRMVNRKQIEAKIHQKILNIKHHLALLDL